MDLQNSIINEPVDEARFTIEPAGPTLVDDQVEDRSYEISGSPDGLTAMDRQFAENLRLIAEEDTGVSIVVESIHHPFYRSSCGPNAVLLSIALQGVPPDLEGILAEVPPNERECSFATLQSMTERRGLYCVAANLTWEQLTRFGDNAILQLISNEKQESHFVVGKACGDTIRIVPGPSPVRRVDREVFLESWSGNALLISKSPIDTVSLFASTRKMWPFVGGVALLALAGIAFVFAKKSKKPDSVEAPVA